MLKKLNGEPIKRDRPDVIFKTPRGKTVKLTFERCEYRAYVDVGGAWNEMLLGSVIPESLRKYIEERY